MPIRCSEYHVDEFPLFPYEKVPGGVSGIRLIYGSPRIKSLRTLAGAEDDFLAPSETFVFTIGLEFQKGAEAKHRLRPDVTKNLEVEFSQISFGDGTGFIGGHRRDYRGKGPPPKRNHSEGRKKTKSNEPPS